MPLIKAVYILDEEGQPFFIKETYSQGTGISAHALLSGFMSAFQQFASELGSEHAKVVKLGNNKIISLKDNISNFQFVLKVDLKAKDKKMLNIVNLLMNSFIEIFTDNLKAEGIKKQQLITRFSEELDEVLNEKSKIDSFLDKL